MPASRAIMPNNRSDSSIGAGGEGFAGDFEAVHVPQREEEYGKIRDGEAATIEGERSCSADAASCDVGG